MNITLRDVPPEVHRYLKERAKANGRSLNMEAVSILSNVSPMEINDREAFLKKLDRDREKTGVFVKQSELRKIIREGRR